jgi:filamentous hemagglutinin
MVGGAQTSVNLTKANRLDTSNLKNKLEGYLLDPAHSQNQAKANWFQQALGFDKNNWQKLGAQIKFNQSSAAVTKITQYGNTLEQVIPITGTNGRIIDVTFVFMKDNTGTVRLVTGIPTKK